MPTLVFDKGTGVTRELLQDRFRLENIDARVFFYPLSSMDVFPLEAENQIAFDIPGRAINLPSYHDVTLDELGRIVAVIEDVCARI